MLAVQHVLRNARRRNNYGVAFTTTPSFRTSENGRKEKFENPVGVLDDESLKAVETGDGLIVVPLLLSFLGRWWLLSFLDLPSG